MRLNDDIFAKYFELCIYTHFKQSFLKNFLIHAVLMAIDIATTQKYLEFFE